MYLGKRREQNSTSERSKSRFQVLAEVVLQSTLRITWTRHVYDTSSTAIGKMREGSVACFLTSFLRSGLLRANMREGGTEREREKERKKERDGLIEREQEVREAVRGFMTERADTISKSFRD